MTIDSEHRRQESERRRHPLRSSGPSHRLNRHAVGTCMGAIAIALISFGGCGGSDKKAEKPARPEPVQDPDEGLDSGDEMVAPEILDGIQRTFARKQTVIARCFVEGVDAGEYPKTARGFVTVGATITPQGRARDAKVLKASLRSDVLHSCITALVETWEFDEPPRNVETSFTYSLERL